MEQKREPEARKERKGEVSSGTHLRVRTRLNLLQESLLSYDIFDIFAFKRETEL